MRTLNRKPGKFTHIEPDPHITADKFNELKNKLERLEKARPRAREEVKRLAAMGDFSENFAYQMAKGKLRGINNWILKSKEILKRAQIIEPKKNDVVGLGNSVTIESAGKQRTYKILGPSETNPSAGIISHKSPLGLALINKQVGDVVQIKLDGRVVEYRVVDIK